MACCLEECAASYRSWSERDMGVGNTRCAKDGCEQPHDDTGSRTRSRQETRREEQEQRGTGPQPQVMLECSLAHDFSRGKVAFTREGLTERAQNGQRVLEVSSTGTPNNWGVEMF